jgi:hypothetical protein
MLQIRNVQSSERRHRCSVHFGRSKRVHLIFLHAFLEEEIVSLLWKRCVERNSVIENLSMVWAKQKKSFLDKGSHEPPQEVSMVTTHFINGTV